MELNQSLVKAQDQSQSVHAGGRAVPAKARQSGLSVAEAAAQAANARASRSSQAVQALDQRRAAPFLDNLQVTNGLGLCA